MSNGLLLVTKPPPVSPIEAGAWDGDTRTLLIKNFGQLSEATGGVERLRTLVLDLAISGRLSGGSSPDGKLNASRDYASRKRPFAVPTGWDWYELGNLARFINGDRGKNYPSKAHRVESGVPFINAGHLRDGRVDSRDMDYISKERFDLLRGGKIQDGDILYCLRGSLGKSGLVVGIGRGAIASSLVIIRPNEETCYARYLLCYLDGSLGRSLIRKHDNGTAQPNLSATDVAKFIVPLPSLAEQKRIVAKVDELMRMLDDLEAKQTLKRKAQARLRSAALGALTSADGRDELSAAWTRIERNFEMLFDTAESVSALRQAVIDVVVAGPPSWPIQSARDVVLETRYGTARKCGRDSTLTPVLRIPNVVRGTLDLEDLKYTSFPAGELSDLRLRANDVLVVRSNGSRDLVGRACVVDRRVEGFAFAGYLIRVRLREDAVLPGWFQLSMQSSALRRSIEGPARTTSGVHNVNTKELLNLALPVPPLYTQAAVLHRVAKMLKLCDDLEAKLQRSEATASKLVEALVAEMVA